MEWLYLGLRFAITSIPFVIAFLLPLFLIYGVWSFYYRPVAAAGAVIWVFALEAIIVIQPALPLGIKLFIPDLLFLLVGIAGFLRFFGLKLHRQHYLWLLFGAVLMVSFAIGTVRHGTEAGIEFRTFFYFWTGIWYLMTAQLTAEQIDKVMRIYMFVAAVLVVVAVLRWMAIALNLDVVHYWNEGGGSLRVFNAAQTFYLGQAFVIGFYAYLNKTGPVWWRAFLPILFVCVVVLQHRTVWAVTLVSVALVFLLAGRIRSKVASTFLAAGVIGAAVLLPFFMGGQLDVVQQSLAHSVQEVGEENSTLAWRVQSWQSLIEQWAYGGPLVNMIGNPFGSGFSRYIDLTQGELTQNPHNHYVYALLRVGLIGVFAMMATYFMVIRAMRRVDFHSKSKLADNNLLIALIAGQLTFFVAYPVQYSQLIPLGLSLVLLNQYRSEIAAASRAKKV